MKGEKTRSEKPKFRHRCYMSPKYVKRLRREAMERLGVKLLTEDRVEDVLLEDGTRVYAMMGKPVAFRKEGILLPTIYAVLDGLIDPPSVVVDRGAVPAVVRGADVMIPGIVRMDERIEKGNVVVVTEETYGRPIAIGIALLDHHEMDKEERGRAFQVVHHVGDKIWKIGEWL
ncbi:MAG: PUA domain-containing protein [Candidatus Bathyarchaeia archaeon]